MSQQERDERIALNESRFREINDRVQRDVTQLSRPPSTMEFVCECAHLDCRAQISLGHEDYEAVRRDPRLFVIALGHEMPEAEDVVQMHRTYAVVRKHVNVQHVVERTDPRSGGAGR